MFGHKEPGIPAKRNKLCRHIQMAEHIHQESIFKGIPISIGNDHPQPGPSRLGCFQHPTFGAGPLNSQDLCILGLQRIRRPCFIAGHSQDQIKLVIRDKGRVLGKHLLGIQVRPWRHIYRQHRPRWLHPVIHQREFHHIGALFYIVPVVSHRRGGKNNLTFAIGRYLELVRLLSATNHHNFRIGCLQLKALTNGRRRIHYNSEDSLLTKLPFGAVIIHLERDAFQRTVIHYFQRPGVARVQG